MKVITKEMLQSPTVTLSWQRKIGILLDRDTALLSAVYNCYRRGITFVPLDARWPRDRLCGILQNAGVDTVLTARTYADRFAEATILCVENDVVVDFTPPEEENDMAYYAHTSGTTGTPKCIAISRPSLDHFIAGMGAIIDFSPGKRISCLAAPSFDVFMLESIGALEMGLSIVLANEEEQINPKLLGALITEGQVDIVQMTPSRMQLLLNFDPSVSCLANVSKILLGGESLPRPLLEVLRANTTAKIYNLYGPTETTVWATAGEMTEANHIHIGRPLPGVEIYITDAQMNQVPAGGTGEICIGGTGLAWGYVGNAKLTEEKFLTLPGRPDTKVYRTGDLGRLLPGGDLEYLGRRDNQIKIRGHRIEPEEIEFYLNQIPGIRQSVVTGRSVSDMDVVLEAYYVGDACFLSQEIIRHLEQKLPAYMIPAVYKRVEAFPLSSNGKINRSSVFQCKEMKGEEPGAEACSMTERQKKILSVITSNIIQPPADPVRLDAALAEIGIDSITFIRIVIALEEAFNIKFEDEILILSEFPTVKDLIDYVDEKNLQQDVPA